MRKTEKSNPSPAEFNGRDVDGRFAKGNKVGKGNPLAARVQKLRAAMLNCVTTKDVKDVVAVILKQAKAGDLVACRELLDRCLGKPLEADVLDKIQQIEEVLNEFEQQNK
jgi:hypothetical protein